MIRQLFPVIVLLIGVGLLGFSFTEFAGDMSGTLIFISANIIWFAGTWLLRRLVNLYLLPFLLSKEKQSDIPNVLKTITAGVLWGLSLSIFLSLYYEYDLTGLWTTSSVLLAVIGFALRTVLLDLFSGIAMGLDRPFEIGDWIRVANDELVGRVESINWRITTLVTRDNMVRLVPNSLLSADTVLNYGTGRYFREKIDILLDYSVSAHRAERILVGSALSVPEIQHAVKAPDTLIKEFTEHGVNWELRFWLNDYDRRDSLKYQVQKNILKNLYVSGLTASREKMEVSYSRNMPDIEDRDDVQFLLKHTEVFQSLPEEEIRFLSKRAIRRLYHAGETIYTFNDKARSLFLILEGTLSVRMASSNSNDLVEVAKLKSGELFGIKALRVGAFRTSHIQADIDSIVYELKTKYVEPMLNERQGLVIALNEVLKKRERSYHTHLRNTVDEVDSPDGHAQGNLLTRIHKVFSK